MPDRPPKVVTPECSFQCWTARPTRVVYCGLDGMGEGAHTGSILRCLVITFVLYSEVPPPPPSASAIILLGFPTLVKRHRRTIERAVTRIHMRLDENSDYTTDRIQCHSTREPEIWSGVRRPAHCTCITEEALPFARFCTLMACRTHGTGRMARGRGKML